jgi:hypothetical protein
VPFKERGGRFYVGDHAAAERRNLSRVTRANCVGLKTQSV